MDPYGWKEFLDAQGESDSQHEEAVEDRLCLWGLPRHGLSSAGSPCYVGIERTNGPKMQTKVHIISVLFGGKVLSFLNSAIQHQRSYYIAAATVLGMVGGHGTVVQVDSTVVDKEVFSGHRCVEIDVGVRRLHPSSRSMTSAERTIILSEESGLFRCVLGRSLYRHRPFLEVALINN